MWPKRLRICYLFLRGKAIRIRLLFMLLIQFWWKDGKDIMQLLINWQELVNLLRFYRVLMIKMLKFGHFRANIIQKLTLFSMISRLIGTFLTIGSIRRWMTWSWCLTRLKLLKMISLMKSRNRKLECFIWRINILINNIIMICKKNLLTFR